MSRYIHNLIAEGEHQQLDFKFEISDAKKIARTFSSFANTKGGKLLIGVKDNGGITGIRSEEEEYMIESSAHIFCKPAVEYTVKPWTIKGKTILEVTVPESDQKPHLAPWKEDTWKAFVRVHDQNFLANSVLLEVWKNKSKTKGVLVRYKEDEQHILEFLKSEKEANLKKLQKACNLSYQKTKRILINLVTIEVLNMRITEKETYYSIQPDHS